MVVRPPVERLPTQAQTHVLTKKKANNCVFPVVVLQVLKRQHAGSSRLSGPFIDASVQRVWDVSLHGLTSFFLYMSGQVHHNCK